MPEKMPQKMIEEYLASLRRRNYSPDTIRNYRCCLERFQRQCAAPLEEAGRADVARFTDALLDEGLKAKSINGYLHALRGMYEYMREERGREGEEPVREKDLLKQDRPLPRPLSEEEVDDLFAVIQSLRDHAMFLLMLRGGLRVSEVNNLDVRDIQVREKRVFIREGKGRKDRVVCLSGDVMRVLREYMLARAAAPEEEALFVVEKGTHKGRRLSVRGIQKRMEHYAKKSGVKACCHRLRHTFATQLLAEGMRLIYIKVLMGHSWITTTQQYCKITNGRVTRNFNTCIENIERKSRRRQARKEAAMQEETG
ncbi:tyrosine-type recombinase/integrase [bacterium]